MLFKRGRKTASNLNRRSKKNSYASRPWSLPVNGYDGYEGNSRNFSLDEKPFLNEGAAQNQRSSNEKNTQGHFSFASGYYPQIKGPVQGKKNHKKWRSFLRLFVFLATVVCVLMGASYFVNNAKIKPYRQVFYPNINLRH